MLGKTPELGLDVLGATNQSWAGPTSSSPLILSTAGYNTVGLQQGAGNLSQGYICGPTALQTMTWKGTMGVTRAENSSEREINGSTASGSQKAAPDLRGAT